MFTFRGGKPRSRSPHVAVPTRFQRVPDPVRLTYQWRMSEVSIPNAQRHPFAFKAKSEAARNTHPWRRAVVTIHIPYDGNRTISSRLRYLTASPSKVMMCYYYLMTLVMLRSQSARISGEGC